MTETATYLRYNVEHRGSMHLACKVETDYVVSEGETLGIMVWAPGVKNYSSANKIWESYELKDDGAGTYYYASMPIAAKNIATKYQYAAVVKNGNTVTLLSKPEAKSIEDWAQEKLESATDPARINLYNQVIAYGKASSAVLSK